MTFEEGGGEGGGLEGGGEGEVVNDWCDDRPMKA